MLASERAKRAIELRLQGWEFSDIAEQCGYASASGAYHAWKRHIQRIPREAVEEARMEAGMRLRQAMRQISANKEKGDPRAAEAYAKLEERFDKLFGLDVPSEQAGVSAQPIIREYQPGIIDAV